MTMEKYPPTWENFMVHEVNNFLFFIFFFSLRITTITLSLPLLFSCLGLGRMRLSMVMYKHVKMNQQQKIDDWDCHFIVYNCNETNRIVGELLLH